MSPSPLIKGIFVNSHIKKLREDRGEESVQELEQRFGKPIDFKNLEDVPVRDEVALLEIIVDMTDTRTLTPSERSRAAGVLHFKNFATTSYGRLLLASLPATPTNFKVLLKNSPYIARKVFSHTNFSSEEYNGTLIITMQNSDYPIEHFSGFFEEWMQTMGFTNPRVTAKKKDQGTYSYTLDGS